jgi:phosphoglycerate dehydrogenase-like enzyme
VLDVFEHEPLPAESPLWDMPNVIISPHIGGDEAGTPRAFGEVFLANLRRYLAGEPLENVVDKRVGFVP